MIMGKTSLCFWSLERLKRQLVGQEVSPTQEFVYLLLGLLMQFSNGIALAPDPADTSADIFLRWFSLGVTIAGMIFTFWCNGGPKGREFQKRFFALYWVLSIRFLLISLLPIMLWVHVSVISNLTDEESQWADTVLVALLQLVFYWRLSIHIGSIAYGEEH